MPGWFPKRLRDLRNLDTDLPEALASVDPWLLPEGPAGPAGPEGPTGPAGADGAPGAQGPAGSKGDQGDVGLSGAAGAEGPQGPAGPAGAQGPAGAKGDKGDTGDAGAAGAVGAQGAQGVKGDTGAQGAAGAQGPQGDPGAAGAQGTPGSPSAVLTAAYYFVPYIGGLTTTNTWGSGNNRTTQWDVPNAVNLVRVGLEVTSAGSAGCVVRVGVYADDGFGRPGALVKDCGTIAADAIGVVYSAVVNQALPAGRYHIGGTLQGAPATQPTIRTSNIPGIGPVAMPSGPGVNQVSWGYTQSGINGALPANFVVGGTGGVSPRFVVQLS